MTEYDLGQVVGAKGDKGDTGNGIASIELISTSGKNKTYRITFTDGTHYDYVVKDGSDASVTIQTAWGSTVSDAKVPSEKLTKNTLDEKQPLLVSGTNIKTVNSTSLLGAGDISIPVVDVTTNWSNPLTDTKVPSERLVKNALDGKASTSHSHYNNHISSTDTGDLEIIPQGEQMPVPIGQYLKGLEDEVDSAVKTTDIANNLTTTTAGKVLDARQGKALADLIGDAITYINQ